MFEYEDLQTFVEVADAGGVTAAAKRLGIAKSMVSRRLQRLETELGAQLLARTTRGASLTEAGTTFRDHAARALGELDLARETLLPEGDLRGRLRIAAPLSFGATHLSPVLAAWAKQHPLLHVHTSYSDNFVDLVGEGYDVAIRIGYLVDSNLVTRRIGPIRATLVASPAYIEARGVPSCPDEIAEHEALMQGTEPWRFLDGSKTVTVHPQGRFKANSGTALVSAAVDGLGIAALPNFLIEAAVAAGTLVPVMSHYPLPEAGLYVVRPPGAQPSRKIRMLTELLVARFGDWNGSARANA